MISFLHGHTQAPTVFYGGEGLGMGFAVIQRAPSPSGSPVDACRRSTAGATAASAILAAVEVYPTHLNIGHKQLVLLQQLSKLAEAVAMGLFNSGNHGKCGHLPAPSLGGSEACVVVVALLVLIVLGRARCR